MKTTPLQQYVMSQLKKDNSLIIELLLTAIEKTCSKETLEQILTVVILNKEKENDIQNGTPTISGEVCISYEGSANEPIKAKAIEIFMNLLHVSRNEATYYVEFCDMQRTHIRINKISTKTKDELVIALEELGYGVTVSYEYI